MRIHKPPKPIDIRWSLGLLSAARIVVSLQRFEIPRQRKLLPIQMHPAAIGDDSTLIQGFRGLSVSSAAAFFFRSMPWMAA